MSYYLAPSLAALREEVNARFPRRDKASDGWIGDTSHQARPSDHNPDWDSGGVVRALDIDAGPDRVRDVDLRRVLLNALVGDSRVWYVISNGRIYSRTYGWEARRYTGSNPHTTHLHVSIRHTRTAERDTSRWLAERKRRTRPRVVDLSALRDAWRDGEHSVHVRRVQRLLNRELKAGLATDGIAGDQTKRAWREFERRRAANRWPDERSLSLLVKGEMRWRR